MATPISEERKLHNDLISYLLEWLDKDHKHNNYEKWKIYSKEYFKIPTMRTSYSILNDFEEMEKVGAIAVGKYNALIKIFKKLDMRAVKEIKNTGAQIKKLKQERRKYTKEETEKMLKAKVMPKSKTDEAFMETLDSLCNTLESFVTYIDSTKDWQTEFETIYDTLKEQNVICEKSKINSLLKTITSKVQFLCKDGSANARFLRRTFQFVETMNEKYKCNICDLDDGCIQFILRFSCREDKMKCLEDPIKGFLESDINEYFIFCSEVWNSARTAFSTMLLTDDEWEERIILAKYPFVRSPKGTQAEETKSKSTIDKAETRSCALELQSDVCHEDKREAVKPKTTEKKEHTQHNETRNKCSSIILTNVNREMRDIGGPTNNSLVVAAVDIGTSYSGYAFHFDKDTDMNEIVIPSWSGQGLISHKTSSTILFDENKDFVEFGFEAEERYASLVEDEMHEDYYYFQGFKTKLTEFNRELLRDIKVQDNTGKELPLLLILTNTIRYFKEQLLHRLKSSNIDQNEIDWVVTVPGMWNDPARMLMREAAEEAGILRNKLLICCEEEAAAATLKSNVPYVERCFRTPGQKVMILDAGGSLNTYVFETNEEGIPVEIITSYVQDADARGVNKAFESLLSELAGLDVEAVDEFQKECPLDYLEMFREVELKKRSFSSNTETLFFRIPFSLIERFTMKPPNFHNDKLRLRNTDFHSCFQNIISDITNHVAEILNIQNTKLTNQILLVGGFSESFVLQDAIRKRFPSCQVVVPTDAGLAILRGAILLRRMPPIVTSRILRYTYGIETLKKFDDDIHELQRMEMINGKTYCRNIFDIHVQTGQKIKEGLTTSRMYSPVVKQQQIIAINIYVSNDKCPKYTDEGSTSFLGKITFDQTDISYGLDRYVEVRFFFGSTEIHVEARDVTTGIIINTHLDFLSAEEQ